MCSYDKLSCTKSFALISIKCFHQCNYFFNVTRWWFKCFAISFVLIDIFEYQYSLVVKALGLGCEPQFPRLNPHEDFVYIYWTKFFKSNSFHLNCLFLTNLFHLRLMHYVIFHNEVVFCWFFKDIMSICNSFNVKPSVLHALLLHITFQTFYKSLQMFTF